MTTLRSAERSRRFPRSRRPPRRCPVARTPAGPWYLARYDDVLAATQDIELFQASFRQPGVVVPDEEQLINEIPEPRHGQVRRIINSAIAVHRLVNIEPFCERAVQRPARRPARTRRTGRPRHRVRDAGAQQRDRPSPRRATRGLPPLGRVVRRGRAGHVARDQPQRAWRGPAGRAPRVRELRRRADRRPRRDDPRDDFITRLAPEPRSTAGASPTSRRARSSCSSSSPATRRPAISSATCSGRSRTSPRSSSSCAPTASSCRPRSRSRCATTRPSAFLLRNCMHERELHGEHLDPGDKVAFGLLSANRDESVFDDPARVPPRPARPARSPRVRRRAARAARARAWPGSRRASRSACSSTASPTIRPVDPGAYEEVPVAWAHGPRRLPSSSARSLEVGDDAGPVVGVGSAVVGEADRVGNAVEPRAQRGRRSSPAAPTTATARARRRRSARPCRSTGPPSTAG